MCIVKLEWIKEWYKKNDNYLMTFAILIRLASLYPDNYQYSQEILVCLRIIKKNSTSKTTKSQLILLQSLIKKRFSNTTNSNTISNHIKKIINTKNDDFSNKIEKHNEEKKRESIIALSLL